MQLTTKIFIEKANKIHNDLYDYSLVEYKNSHIKVKIICKLHGIFEQLPYHHTNSGSGCQICSGRKKSNTSEFIEKCLKVHKNEYDYSLVKYCNNTTKIKIICKIHGTFEQIPKDHLGGKGCKNCYKWDLKTNEQFIVDAQKIHHQKYDYSLTNYNGAHNKIIIKCNKCNKNFFQKPNAHLMGHGCPVCSFGPVSQIETKWLNDMNISTEYRNKTIKLFPGTRYNVDGYDPNTNTVYEFLGDFWHGNPNVFDKEKINPFSKKSYGQLYDATMNRIDLLKQQGYNVVYVWEQDYKGK